MLMNSEKLVAAKVALKKSADSERNSTVAYKVVSGGVTIYYGTKKNEAASAYADTGRKDKNFYKIDGEYITVLG